MTTQFAMGPSHLSHGPSAETVAPPCGLVVGVTSSSHGLAAMTSISPHVPMAMSTTPVHDAAFPHCHVTKKTFPLQVLAAETTFPTHSLEAGAVEHPHGLTTI